MKALRKNLVVGAIIMCSLATASFTPIDSFASSQAPTIVINGRSIYTESTPYIKEGTTMVPLRVISEKLGATVYWDGETQTITIKKKIDGATYGIELTIGKVAARVNGETKTLTYAPEIINGTTFVPLRFISEALDCEVGYEPVTKKVTVTDNNYEEPDWDNATVDTVINKDQDMFGRQIRTTNLPSNAEDFPYIVEGIPNWAYECQAKSWINNYWGPRYFVPSEGDDGKSNTKGIKPVELFNELKIGGGNTELATAAYKYYDNLYNYLDALTNIDYRTIDEETFVNAIADNTDSSTIADFDVYKNDIRNYFKLLSKYQVITHSEFQIMPEAAWTGYNFMSPHIYVPVYMKFTVDNTTDSEGNYNTFGLCQTEAQDRETIYMKTGITYEGVITLILTKDDTDNGEFKVLHHYSDITGQLLPQMDITDGVAPDMKDKNAYTSFYYTWLPEGSNPYDKYTRPTDCDLVKWSS